MNENEEMFRTTLQNICGLNAAHAQRLMVPINIINGEPLLMIRDDDLTNGFSTAIQPNVLKHSKTRAYQRWIGIQLDIYRKFHITNPTAFTADICNGMTRKEAIGTSRRTTEVNIYTLAERET